MTDIFFSYSSTDRKRVRPIRDALVAQGFEVFWDQQVPAGMDWDTWIRHAKPSASCRAIGWLIGPPGSYEGCHDCLLRLRCLKQPRFARLCPHIFILIFAPGSLPRFGEALFVPGSRSALDSGAHHPAAGHPGGA